MAANKFATMLHRNTNKITLILIYAVLEWTLIVLLLLNSLFSYLILKFAEYFGLKPPCPWCSRVDQLFGQGKNANIHRDLLCEAHAREVSRLGYCEIHRTLGVLQDMCEDCYSSWPDFSGVAKNYALLQGIREIENEEVSLLCSCCGVNLDGYVYSPLIVVKPYSDALENTQNLNLMIEDVKDEQYDNLGKLSQDYNTHHLENEGNQVLSDDNEGFSLKTGEEMKTDSVSVSEVGETERVDIVLEGEKESIKEVSKMIMKDEAIQVCIGEDASMEILPQDLEFFLDYSGNQLVPIELIDSTTEEDQSRYQVKDEDHEKNDQRGASLSAEVHYEGEGELVFKSSNRETEKDALLVSLTEEEEPKYMVMESMELEEDENSFVFHAREFYSDGEAFIEFTSAQATQASSSDDNFQRKMAREGEENDIVQTVSEEIREMPVNETEAEVSIGTEIPDLDQIEEMQVQENISSHISTDEGPSASSTFFEASGDYHGSKKDEQQTLDLNCPSLDVEEDVMNNQSSLGSDINDVEDDKFPDTPTSVDSLHKLHRRLLLLEKKDSGTDESLDGSVTSELEGGDGVVTVESLKTALRSERKALQALYAELEEERSASAVAANQTMAMINRLQEEKAAMQMEALQYQRMMEEQSEYDQEALQLLNELMVKREKEKQELEKELEVYRKKVLEYEAKEKTRMMRKSKDGSSRSVFSSASCSNCEDSDGLSIDLNQEAKEEDGSHGHHENGNHHTPIDDVVNLDESLSDFEEERLAILEQLKALEEKLMIMDEEEPIYEDVKLIEDLHNENGEHMDENGHLSGEVNGHTNGFPKIMNGKHHPDRRTINSKGKQLLPLFDAICDENGDILLNGNENGHDFISNGVHDSHIQNIRPEIEEELDNLHERLQALEEDREFLRHCISSVKKGDKGMDLLQQILQHLRDLRNVELRARDFHDGSHYD